MNGQACESGQYASRDQSRKFIEATATFAALTIVEKNTGSPTICANRTRRLQSSQKGPEGEAVRRR
jgi:hypothetical protein